MSKGKHTPGPWKIWSSRKGLNGPEIGHLITSIRHGEYNNELVSFAQYAGGKTYPELEANARLIAAAPELLEALEKAHRFLRKNGYNMTEIDSAIAKAKGEPAP